MKTLPTQNPEWGFFGTAALRGWNPIDTFRQASLAMATVLSPEAARDYLDSTYGHLCDMIQDEQDVRLRIVELLHEREWRQSVRRFLSFRAKV